MPDGILHILRVDPLVQFKLVSALLVLADVVVADSSLPMMWQAFGPQFENPIEILNRLRLYDQP